jgi:hypothetical protein
MNLSRAVRAVVMVRQPTEACSSGGAFVSGSASFRLDEL